MTATGGFLERSTLCQVRSNGHNFFFLVQAGQCGNQIGAKFWRSSLTSMVSILQAPTTVTRTSSSSASTSTSTKPQEVAMCREPS